MDMFVLPKYRNTLLPPYVHICEVRTEIVKNTQKRDWIILQLSIFVAFI